MNEGISGNSGEWAHLVLEWPDGKIEVKPNGTITYEGELIPREATAEIGTLFQEWADFMASTTPGVESGACTIGAREVLRAVLWRVTDIATLDGIAADIAQRRAAL